MASIDATICGDTIYGPASEGGLNLNHLYETHGLLHLEKFTRFLGSDTITGKLLTVTIELSTFLELGIGRNLFQLDYDKFGILLSTSWIKSLWSFSHSHSITITDRVHSYPQISRENDLFLMEAFEAQGFSQEKLQILNHCRKFLQVLTLSDIMIGQGDSFTSSFLCQRNHQKQNTYHWPFQLEPSQKMKKLWKSALRTTFKLKADTTAYKLGNWLHHSDIKEWICFFICPLNGSIRNLDSSGEFGKERPAGAEWDKDPSSNI